MQFVTLRLVKPLSRRGFVPNGVKERNINDAEVYKHPLTQALKKGKNPMLTQ